MPSSRFVLVIVNSIPPYVYEINNILSLPDGFKHHVRYRRNWIDADDPTDFENCDGLILLRVFETGTVIPIRKIHINVVTQVGDLCFFDFSLMSIVDFSRDDSTRAEQLERVNGILKNILKPYSNVPGKNMRASILPATDPTYFLDSELVSSSSQGKMPSLNSWGTMLEILGGFDFYDGFDFIKVVALKNNKDQLVPIDKVGTKVAYRMMGGQGYTLTILQSVPLSTGSRISKAPDGTIIYQTVDDKHLEVFSPSTKMTVGLNKQQIKGRYDIYNIYCQTENIYSRIFSDIILAVIQGEKENLKKISEIAIPVSLGVSLGSLFIRITSIILFMASAMIVVFPDLLDQVFAISISPVHGGFSMIQRLALLVMIITSWSFPKLSESISSIFTTWL